MGNETRKLERTDFDDEQIDALAANDNGLDAAGLEDIQDIRVKLSEEMTRAKMEGIINEKDFDKFNSEIRRNNRNKKGMEQIENKVKSVIEENKGLIDTFVAGLTGEADIDKKLDREAHIKRFKALSTEEKRTYVTNLRKNLEWVTSLYEEVSKHAPDKIPEFRVMGGKEKKALVEELKQRDKNKKAYLKLIKGNREHFSKESEEEWMREFGHKTAAEQQEWIRQFPEQLKQKDEVTNKFKAFPPEIRAKFPEFFESRKKGRIVILQNMERAMEKDHLSVLKGGNSEHFSEEDRKEAMRWWKHFTDQFNSSASPENMKAAMKTLNDMLTNLPAHMEKAAEKGKEYEKFPDNVKLDLQEMHNFTKFYDQTFEKKTKICEDGKKLSEGMDKMEVIYLGKLQDAMAKGYMGKATADSFIKDFKELGTNEKREWMDKFDTNELTKRKEVTEKFRTELPEEIQAKNADFYQFGYTDRMGRLAKLLGLDVNELGEDKAESAEKDQSIEGMSAQAMKLERAGNSTDSMDLKKSAWKEALQIYQKLLKLTPADEILQSNHDRLAAKFEKTFPNEALPQADDETANLDQYEIDAALDQASGGEVMHEQMKRLTIAEKLTEFAAKSENYNDKTFDARDKTKHLDGEFKKTLNQRLIEHTADEMVLNEDGESQKIQKVDVNAIGKQESAEVYRLQREITTRRDVESQRNVHHIQATDRETGKITTAQTAADKVRKQREQIQNQMAERAQQKFAAQGKKLNKKEEEELRKQAANQNTDVELSNAA